MPAYVVASSPTRRAMHARHLVTMAEARRRLALWLDFGDTSAADGCRATWHLYRQHARTLRTICGLARLPR